MTGASGALQQVHVPLRKTRTFISNLKLANMTLFRTEFIHFGFYLWIVDCGLGPVPERRDLYR